MKQDTTNWKKQAQEIWSILNKVSKSQEEFDRKFEKTKKEADKRAREADLRLKESDLQFQQMKKEARIETKALKKRMKELNELFTGQWGKLMESLVEGDLVKLLNERGIKIQRITSRMKGEYKGETREFDLIGINGKEVVVVEVKTTLGIGDVKEFLKNLKDFKQYCPEYKHNKVYGAVAYLRANSKSNTFSKKQGLFVIRATGNSASIINKASFKPKVF